MMADRTDVVVLGGGVIGAFCALYLAREGQRVTLIEQSTIGSGCSRGNCGYVSPSHVLPLAEPGIMGKTLKSMLTPESPFHIRPRFDLALMSWLTNFARKCNTRDMMAAGRALNDILRLSFTEYESILATEQLDAEWQKTGLLFVYRSPSEFEHFRASNEMLGAQFDRPAQVMTGSELEAFEPTLKPGNAGAYFYDCDAQIRPERLMASLANVLRAKGVTVLENTSASSIVTRNGEFVGVETSVGLIEGTNFVLAAGALTPKFQHDLSCKLPIQPGKGLSVTLKRPAKCPHVPIIFHDHRVAITPFEQGLRIGSTMEFAGYDTSINPKRLALLTNATKLYFDELDIEPQSPPWYGWRPMTYDSLPIIGPAPRVKNAYVASGHSMLGLSLGAGTGRMIADMILKRPNAIPAEPFAITRF